jgi:hypothetical protein
MILMTIGLALGMLTTLGFASWANEMDTEEKNK